jgi:uncharacterized protein YyaL (SSP411 family)
MPSFVDICRAVDDAWRNRRDQLLTQAGQLTEAIGRATPAAPLDASLPGRDALTSAYRQLRAQHDDQWGGFGGAPKFPQTMSLELLLRSHARNEREQTLGVAQTSLDAMAAGGIYDHLGGGFARYSVDGMWLVPHFEKMLYDQALLARVYLHAWQLTRAPTYRQVLDETIEYVLRDLRDPSGGFFAAEDADSEGVEGKFYVWTPEAVRAAVADDALAQVALEWYGVTDEGNFEGQTILNRIAHRGDLLRPPDVEEARQRLFEARTKRVRPGLDDKVLAEWNGLMLATLAEAAAATGNERWLDEARRTGDFLLHNLRRADGRWLRSWQSARGAGATLAFAADHGALVDGFTRLAEATGEARWIGAAIDTADALLGLFWDDDDGGVFTTGHDAERLVTRPKDLLDNATPSASSLAAVGLLRLGALTGVDRYTERAEDILRSLGELAAQHPTAFGHLLTAVDITDAGVTEIAVVGERDDLVRAVCERYLPTSVLAWGQPYDSPLWEARQEGFAYVCRHYACQAPTDSVNALLGQLEQPTA